MLESQNVSSETTIDPAELKELISRLSNPSTVAPPGSVTVNDIAETLDIPQDRVIAEIARMRTSKAPTHVPINTAGETPLDRILQTPEGAKRLRVVVVVMTLAFVSLMLMLTIATQRREVVLTPSPPHPVDVSKVAPTPP